MNSHAQEAEKFRRMTETPIPRLITKLGIPTIASMLITNIYNMADTYFVGSLGKSASGAIGVVFTLMAILQAFGFTWGQGSGSIISRRLGQHDSETATRVATTGFWCAFGTGLVISILGLLFLDPLMHLLGSTNTILPYARSYARWILLAGPFYTSSCVLNNILRYEGMSFHAMIGMTIGGILNMILDPILILGFGLGTAGAGIATAFSQIVSFSILLFMFLSGKTQSRLKSPKHLNNGIIPILKIGFPALLRQGLGSLSTTLLNHSAGVYGDAAVAAMSIVGRIVNFVFSFGIGIGQGFQPVAAFNYGAKKYSRVKKGFWFTSFAGEILIGTMAVVCFLFAAPLARLFQPDPQVVEIAVPALRINCFGCLFLAMCVSSNMMFQSTGFAGKSAVLSALRSGLCYIPAILILPMFLGLRGIQLAQPVADVITFAVSVPMALKFLRNLPADHL